MFLGIFISLLILIIFFNIIPSLVLSIKARKEFSLVENELNILFEIDENDCNITKIEQSLKQMFAISIINIFPWIVFFLIQFCGLVVSEETFSRLFFSFYCFIFLPSLLILFTAIFDLKEKTECLEEIEEFKELDSSLNKVRVANIIFLISLFIIVFLPVILMFKMIALG